MKAFRFPFLFLIVLFSCGLVSSPVLPQAAIPQSPWITYQQAFFLEQGKGDISAAIALYERLAREFPDQNAVVARALLRLGICYEVLGEDRAAQTYRMILDRYSDQSEVAAKAREMLSLLEDREKPLDVAVSPPGFALRQLTFLGTQIHDNQAAISPDGARLVFEESSKAPYPLVLADLKTGARRVILEENSPEVGIASRYRWTADGLRLAIQLSATEFASVEVYETASGRKSTWVRSAPGSLELVGWEPGGTSLLVRHTDESGRVALSRYEGAGGATRTGSPDNLNCSDLRTNPNEGWVACATEGENSEILVFSLEERATPVTIASHAGADRSPIWSPDGRYLAFLSDRDQAGSEDLWAVEVKQGRQSGQPFLLVRDLGEGLSLRDWTSDGKLTYYKENRVRDIWALPVDSETLEAIGEGFIPTTLQGRNFQPSVSPDGHRIAFVSSDAENHWTLGIAAIENPEEEFIDLPVDEFFNPTWRDNDRVVLTARDEKGGHFLEYHTGTRQTKRLMGGPDYQWMTESEKWIRSPARPDFDFEGSRLLFNYGSNAQEAALYLLEEMVLSRVEETAGAAMGRFSPDGQWIAYVDALENALRIQATTGDSRRVLARLPREESFGTFCWSPDGRFLVYPRLQEEAISEGDYWTLWAVPLEGGSPQPLSTPRGLNPWWVDWGDSPYLVLGSLYGLPNFFVLENFWPDNLGRE